MPESHLGCESISYLGNPPVGLRRRAPVPTPGVSAQPSATARGSENYSREAHLTHDRRPGVGENRRQSKSACKTQKTVMLPRCLRQVGTINHARLGDPARPHAVLVAKGVCICICPHGKFDSDKPQCFASRQTHPVMQCATWESDAKAAAQQAGGRSNKIWPRQAVEQQTRESHRICR